MTLPKKTPTPKKKEKSSTASAHAAASDAVAALQPPPPFSLVPGSQDFLVASIITTAAWGLQWGRHLGILTLYPELNEGVVAVALGLSAALLWHRLTVVLYERVESKRLLAEKRR